MEYGIWHISMYLLFYLAWLTMYLKNITDVLYK